MFDWLKDRMRAALETKESGQDRENKQPEGHRLLPRPKILLMDLSSDAAKDLSDLGFSVSTGTFGRPYKVEKKDGLTPVVSKWSVPAVYAESDIVVVDLAYYDTASGPEAEKYVSPGDDDWWCSTNKGIVDPRVRNMVSVQSEFQRIFDNGGIIVVFAAPRIYQDLYFGSSEHYRFNKKFDINEDNWSFVDEFREHYFEIRDESGEEIKFTLDSGPLLEIRGYLEGSTYVCSFKTSSFFTGSYVSIAKNKWGNSVAGALLSTKGGFVFLFPQVHRQSEFLKKLFTLVLPSLRPALFPFSETQNWVDRPEYQQPETIRLTEKIAEIERESKQQIATIQEQISQINKENEFCKKILTETGDSLVAHVKQALESLGISPIVDADLAKRESGETDFWDEDLRHESREGVLIIEVKGIFGNPTDSDALQISKHLAPTMRKLERTDVQGLVIFNHQRALPPLERERQPFRETLIQAAEQQGVGLMTTWDLFLIIQSFRRNNWGCDQVKSILYKTGRVLPIPSSYIYIGEIEHYYDRAMVIRINVLDVGFSIGDRIAFDLKLGVEEQVVESIQVEKAAVTSVQPGEKAGVKTVLSKQQAKTGTRVYLVK